MWKREVKMAIAFCICFVYELHNAEVILSIYIQYHISFPRSEIRATGFNKSNQSWEQLAHSDPSNTVLTWTCFLVFSKKKQNL